MHCTIASSLAVIALMGSHPLWGQEPVFADGFEIGGTAAWSSTLGATSGCAGGGALAGALEGDLGPAPTGSFVEISCLEVHNDQGVARFEPAWSGVPIARAAGMVDVADLVVVGEGERRLAAQFVVLSRWGAPLADTTAPIRWLEITLPAKLGPFESARYSLRRYPGLAPPADGFAVEVTTAPGVVTIDTGLATFTLAPEDPRLITGVAIDLDDDGVGRSVVASGAVGTGPRLRFDPGSGPLLLDTSGAGQVVLDPGGFLVARAGPAQAVVRWNGHFVAPGGLSRCTRGGLDYERFGFTVEMRFARGSRDVGLDVHLRNECSDGASSGDGNLLTDDAVAVLEAGFSLPLTIGPVMHLHGGAGAIGTSPPAFAGTTRVAQRRGGGTPWVRRAEASRDAALLESAEAFQRPVVGVSDGVVLAALTMPWMRWREPQALVATASVLRLEVIGENLIVGEGKGVWGAGLLHLAPVGAGAAAQLAGARERLGVQLERGLLVRPTRPFIDGARLFAPLGSNSPSAMTADYLATLEAIHQQTVAPGGQWDRAKTFGSQLWPETQFDEFGVDNPEPFQNFVSTNYWQPVHAEVMEYLRSGEPRWFWDFSGPQMWLQLFSAYLNLGDRTHSNRNGVAVNSGGGGEGHWHRSNFGSDDYTYALGFDVAYATRPSQALLDRIARTGQTLVDRYDVPWAQQATRDPFVNTIDITRGTVQHFTLLANCAELVPGPQGEACHARLLEILTELAADNLSAGVFCEGDVPHPTMCGTGQQFMTNALFYHFFHRMYLMYGDVGGRLLRALVEGPWWYYQAGIDRLGDGVSIDPNGVMAAGMTCTLTNGRQDIASCQRATDGDGNVSVLNPIRPSSLFLLLLAHDLDPTIELCAVARAGLEALDPASRWAAWITTGSGWWKGSAQMLQGATVGVGVYETCGP